MKLEQSASVMIKRTPVTCRQCKELRTQIARCENCGNETPFEEEKNAQTTESTVSATTQSST